VRRALTAARTQGAERLSRDRADFSKLGAEKWDGATRISDSLRARAVPAVPAAPTPRVSLVEMLAHHPRRVKVFMNEWKVPASFSWINTTQSLCFRTWNVRQYKTVATNPNICDIQTSDVLGRPRSHIGDGMRDLIWYGKNDAARNMPSADSMDRCPFW